MKDGPDIARIAALIGDPARANMLAALMDGRALTAGELAAEAGVTPQTASSHLGRLEAGGMLVQRRQGRHRYYALDGADVARVLESLMGLAEARGQSRRRPGPRDAAMRHARVCYNHLAGEQGIRLYQSLTGRGHLTMSGSGLGLSVAGRAAMTGFGIDLAALDAARAPLCRECLDWSERRTHLAGSLGRAILARIEALGWAQRDPKSRAVLFSATGRTCFDRVFPLTTVP
jgi:DNA-binding transcriptional ArsR family regulator